MILQRLQLTDFRCIHSADVEFESSRNLIIGPNGSGKTSLLEGIFLLGSGRSFRASSLNVLVRSLSPELWSIGSFVDRSRMLNIGIRFGPKGRETRVNGQTPRHLADLVKLFPVQIIDPEVHHLLEDGPSRRRAFLDWGVFHVEPLFHDAWRRFNRALKQRNAQLKSGRSDFGVWDTELSMHGAAVTESRKRYADALAAFVGEMGNRLLGHTVSIEYSQGWRKNLTLVEALKESRTRDMERLTTTVGPHRADLLLKIDGHVAKDRVSRGQQKILACCLILAQQLHRASSSKELGCLLLDDPSAELDVDSLGKLLEVVGDLPVQLVATSLSADNLSLFKNAKKFHVEHGSVKPVA